MSEDFDTEVTDAELWARLGEAAGLDRAELLLELGGRAANARHLTQAASLFEEAAAVSLEAQSPQLASMASLRLGSTLFAAQDYAASAEAYGKAAKLCGETGSDVDRADALWGRADALRMAGDLDGALESATESRAFAESEEAFGRAGEACLQQAQALYYLDREEEALAACRDGRDHMRRIGATSRVATIDDFALTVAMYLGDLDLAMELATGCYVLAKTSATSEDDAYAQRRLAEVCLRRGDVEEALANLDQARERYRADDMTLGIARCDELRGRALRELGRSEEALGVFTEARVLFDAAGDDGQALECDSQRSIVMHSLGRFADAASLNQRVIDACRQRDDAQSAFQLHWAVVRLADNYFNAGEPRAVLDAALLWPGEFGGDQEFEPAYLALTSLRARAFDTLGMQEEALAAAQEVIDRMTQETRIGGDVPVSGGFSFAHSGQCSDHAEMSSGVLTCPPLSVSVSPVSKAMERSEK